MKYENESIANNEKREITEIRTSRRTCCTFNFPCYWQMLKTTFITSLEQCPNKLVEDYVKGAKKARTTFKSWLMYHYLSPPPPPPYS